MLEVILADFHFSTLWNGGILIYMGLFLVVYFLLLPDKNFPKWKPVVFVLGMVAIFAALGSPINVIARIKYSTHIIQLIILLFVAAPLLVTGSKNEIFRRGMDMSYVRPILKLLSNPIVCFVTFFGLFYIYHLPAVFNPVRVDLFTNYLMMFALLFAGIMLWMPIVSHFLTKTKKRIYIILTIVFFIPYAIILLLQDQSLYLVYTDAEKFLESLAVCMPNVKDLTPEMAAAFMPYDAVEEQKLGGILLLGSQIILVATLFIAPKYTKEK